MHIKDLVSVKTMQVLFFDFMSMGSELKGQNNSVTG